MKLVIFDCDGTLVDSQHAIFAAMEYAFGSESLPTPDRMHVLGVVGLSLPEAFNVLAPTAPDRIRARLVDHYKGAFAALRAKYNHDEPLYPGIADAIAALSGRPDVVLGIATGKSKRGVARLLDREGWHGRFVTIQTADDHPSKPHPSMILTALAETGAECHRAVMIGDTSFDMEMALAARVAALGVGWGYHDHLRLNRAGAHAIVTDGLALLSAIDAQLDLHEARR